MRPALRSVGVARTWGWGRMRRSFIGLGISLALLFTTTPAVADGPGDEFSAAVAKTARAKTAKIAVSQKTSRGGRTHELNASGSLAAGDSDLVLDSEGGKGHRVAVGTTVKERRPDRPDSSWRTTTRPQPAQTTALGDLRLPDGTSIGDPKLYRSVTDHGTYQLPQGSARELVGELDMGTVAQAM